MAEPYDHENTFNTTHPELRDGEHFFCNTGRGPAESLETYEQRFPQHNFRRGEQAYTTDGKPLNGLVPLFYSQKNPLVMFRCADGYLNELSPGFDPDPKAPVGHFSENKEIAMRFSHAAAMSMIEVAKIWWPSLSKIELVPVW